MEQVTVEKMLMEVGVHPEKLNERISDDHLCEIALFLTEWKTVVPFLGLDENDVDAIEQEEKKEQVKKLKALRKWKSKFVFAATYRKLVEVLLSLGMADVAEKACHLLKGTVRLCKSMQKSSMCTKSTVVSRKYVPPFGSLSLSTKRRGACARDATISLAISPSFPIKHDSIVCRWRPSARYRQVCMSREAERCSKRS